MKKVICNATGSTDSVLLQLLAINVPIEYYFVPRLTENDAS